MPLVTATPSVNVTALTTRTVRRASFLWALAMVLSMAYALTPLTARAQNLTTIYSFVGEPDGAVPYAPLIRDAAGNLYGTTGHGGTANAGTVFEINSQGVETILHSFA